MIFVIIVGFFIGMAIADLSGGVYGKGDYQSVFSDCRDLFERWYEGGPIAKGIEWLNGIIERI